MSQIKIKFKKKKKLYAHLATSDWLDGAIGVSPVLIGSMYLYFESILVQLGTIIWLLVGLLRF